MTEYDTNDFIVALITTRATVSKEEGKVKAKFKKSLNYWVTSAGEIVDDTSNIINPREYGYKIICWMDDYIDGLQVIFSPLSS